MSYIGVSLLANNYTDEFLSYKNNNASNILYDNNNVTAYFDAHFHLFGDNQFGNALAYNIGEESNSDYFFDKYYQYGRLIGGIVMGNGPIENQLYYNYLPESFYYMLGIDQLSYFPLSESILYQIEQHLRNRKCLGAKIYPGYIPIYPNDNQYYQLYELLSKYNKNLAVHTGMLTGSKISDYSRPIYLEDIANVFPLLRIVMCHFGNPLLQEASNVLKSNSNIYADLSGIIEGSFNARAFIESDPRYVDKLLSCISNVENDSKFMFGSDWPAVNCDEYCNFISKFFSNVDNVMINNALSIYNIEMM